MLSGARPKRAGTGLWRRQIITASRSNSCLYGPAVMTMVVVLVLLLHHRTTWNRLDAGTLGTRRNTSAGEDSCREEHVTLGPQPDHSFWENPPPTLVPNPVCVVLQPVPKPADTATRRKNNLERSKLFTNATF